MWIKLNGNLSYDNSGRSIIVNTDKIVYVITPKPDYFTLCLCLDGVKDLFALHYQTYNDLIKDYEKILEGLNVRHD